MFLWSKRYKNHNISWKNTHELGLVHVESSRVNRWTLICREWNYESLKSNKESITAYTYPRRECDERHLHFIDPLNAPRKREWERDKIVSIFATIATFTCTVVVRKLEVWKTSKVSKLWHNKNDAGSHAFKLHAQTISRSRCRC